MKSHGKAGECGSLAVYCHHAAWYLWGLVMVFFGVGGDGAGSGLGLRMHFLSKAIDLGRRRAWWRWVWGCGWDYRRYKAPAVVFSLLGITTLLLDLGFLLGSLAQYGIAGFTLAGFSFQPSELAKPVLILFLAYFLRAVSKPWTTGAIRCCRRRRL